MPKPSRDSTREGGREPAKPVTSGFSGEAPSAPMRNSSGSAAAAASILDLRQKLNGCLELLELLATRIGDAEVATDVKRLRQLGFVRRPRTY